MIVGSFKPMQIGKLITNGTLTDGDKNKHQQPFKVVREATREEWVEYAKSMGAWPLRVWEVESLTHREVWFYEIQTD